MGRQNVTLAMVLIICLVFAGCASMAAVNDSEAACAFGPLPTEPERAAPGEAFRIHEEGFSADCYDSGQEVSRLRSGTY